MASVDAPGASREVGDAGDALGAFAQAAAKWSAATTPDPQVAAALALGWRVGEALTWAAAGTQARPRGVADLGLDDTARWAVLTGQIERMRRALVASAPPTNGATNGAGPKPTPAGDDDAFDGACPPAIAAAEVAAHRAAMLKRLYVVDDSLGKAFRLGHGLQQFCDPAATEPGAAAAQASIPPLKALLMDLGTKLPPNAGHSVRNSLTLWEEQLRTGGPKVLPGLLTQGDSYRALLTGEMAAKDVLRLSDYVGTAEEVIRRLRELAGRALGRMKLLVAIVVVLLVSGIVLLASSGDNWGDLATGAGSLIAAFGLTWKGIGAFFGHAAAQGEQALWDAQVDWAVAYRLTVSVIEPPPKPKGVQRLTGIRHSDAHQRERLRHLETWSDWRAKWPGLDDEGAPPADDAAATPA